MVRYSEDGTCFVNKGADHHATFGVNSNLPPEFLATRMHSRAAYASRWQKCQLAILDKRGRTKPMDGRLYGWIDKELQQLGIPIDLSDSPGNNTNL